MNNPSSKFDAGLWLSNNAPQLGIPIPPEQEKMVVANLELAHAMAEILFAVDIEEDLFALAPTFTPLNT